VIIPGATVESVGKSVVVVESAGDPTVDESEVVTIAAVLVESAEPAQATMSIRASSERSNTARR
jgi:hypothetical protein